MWDSVSRTGSNFGTGLWIGEGEQTRPRKDGGLKID